MALDKQRYCGAAFLGQRCRGSVCWLWLSAAAWHSGSVLLAEDTRVLYYWQKALEFSTTSRSRQPEPACRTPISAQERCAAVPPLVYDRLEFTVTPSVMGHPRGSPPNVYNSPQISSMPSAPYFSGAEAHGVQYQQTFYYNNTPMAAAGDAANMQMMYSNGAPATPVYGSTDYGPQPTQQPHDSPPIAQGLFTPSPQHHGGNPQDNTNDGWSSALKKEFDEPLPSPKKDLARKSIVFCDDAVNVKAALKEQSRDRGDGSSQQLAQEAGSGDCKFENHGGMNHRIGASGRNAQKRAPRRQRSAIPARAARSRCVLFGAAEGSQPPTPTVCRCCVQ
ncbi:hypothetical protein Y032_0320g2382 [Ancylostoma ceylanicum]|uniref:Uncharacterized protein n=1 Tax=Ancylostoma ceylanicum TaxID=53326 RepID=A0A016S0R8_9BILA|nr:hypothetical protein Y032_0320g2382 [Ancylostoma ceylanicum]